ncbi:MAG TPA: thioredoxin [Gemmatimonadales bacterium]|jgi:thioredoxin 1
MEVKGKVQIAQQATFDQLVLASPTPVVVDFWAPWCVYCRKLAPTYEGLATQMSGELKFVTVNVDEERDLQQRFGVSSLPTLKFFCSGREVGEFVGAAPRQQLEAMFRQMLRGYQECLDSSSPLKAG